MNRVLKFAVTIVILVSVIGTFSHSQAADAASNFAPLEHWKNAILAGDAGALKAFYSTNPAAEINLDRVKHDADADVSFWLGLKARSMNVEIVRLLVRPDRASI